MNELKKKKKKDKRQIPFALYICTGAEISFGFQKFALDFVCGIM